jgi:hypothetical protein
MSLQSLEKYRVKSLLSSSFIASFMSILPLYRKKAKTGLDRRLTFR